MGTITLTSPVAGTEIEAGLHATNYAALQTLLNGNLDNANVSATADLDANARVGVRLNTAGSVFERRRLNFIEGSGIDLTVADDSGSEEIDITVAATGVAATFVKGTYSKALTGASDTIVVTHGFGSAPTAVLLTPSATPVHSADIINAWVTTITATHFTINFAHTNGGTMTGSTQSGTWLAA